MRAGAEGRARVDLDAGEPRALRRYLLPGRLNQDVIDHEGMKKGLPVVDPVFVLGEALLDSRLAEIREPREFLEFFPNAA